MNTIMMLTEFRRLMSKLAMDYAVVLNSKKMEGKR